MICATPLITSCDASTGRSPAGRAEGLAARKGIAGLDGREVRAVSTAKISEGSNDSIAVRLEEEHVRLPHVQARGAAHATPLNRLARLGPGLGK